jgi:hypothetical protein
VEIKFHFNPWAVVWQDLGTAVLGFVHQEQKKKIRKQPLHSEDSTSMHHLQIKMEEISSQSSEISSAQEQICMLRVATHWQWERPGVLHELATGSILLQPVFWLPMDPPWASLSSVSKTPEIVPLDYS